MTQQEEFRIRIQRIEDLGRVARNAFDDTLENPHCLRGVRASVRGKNALRLQAKAIRLYAPRIDGDFEQMGDHIEHLNDVLTSGKR